MTITEAVKRQRIEAAKDRVVEAARSMVDNTIPRTEDKARRLLAALHELDHIEKGE